MYLPDPARGLHPHWPERLGLRKLLRLTNPPLARLLDRTDPFTLLQARNRLTLHREASRVLTLGIPGDFVEIGVHRGGSAAILATVLEPVQGRDLHLFDRWGDLPDPTPEDGVRGEEYAKDRIPDKLKRLQEEPPLADTKRVLHDVLGFPADRVHFYEGWYEETLNPDGPYPGRPIAFASIDCDYYESVKLALAFFLQHASVGATAVVDDYGSWPGAQQAVDEYLATNRGITVHRLRTGPAILRLPDRALQSQPA